MTEQFDVGRTPGLESLLHGGALARAIEMSTSAAEKVDLRERHRAAIVEAGLRFAQDFEMASLYGGAADEIRDRTAGWTVSSMRPSGHNPDQRLETSVAQAIALLGVASAMRSPRGDVVFRVLVRSVIRPLCEALGHHCVDEADAKALAARIGSYRSQPAADLDAAVASLADILGKAAGEMNSLPEIIEAAAALERLACRDTSAAVPSAEGATPKLRVAFDGPYLLTGAADLVDHLGVTIPRAQAVALCRCGRSETKPFCDGSHVEASFIGDKDARRVADRRDTYVGQQATIYDNRGLCAHSGFCTDRLSSVFHLGEEPFVTPSGGRLDEIMAAVRKCPSGALSFGLDEQEDRRHVDQPRPAQIEVSKDGPYRITGGIEVLDVAGEKIERPEGASLEHYSLCRCGSSLNKPFCSGMHWSVGFADPLSDPDKEPTLFEWAGGYPALLDTTRIFYSRHVPSDPLIGPLFAAMEADHPERVAAWLSEVFGGPSFYSDRYGGYMRLISQHLDKHLTREQRAHWARLMAQSADEAGLPDDAEFRAAFIGYIEWGSRLAVENSQAGAKPPPNMPVPRWWWVCNATPGARVSALAGATSLPTDVAPPTVAPGEQPSFAAHIKALFRPMDRNSMKFAFDLWSYDDVLRHAEPIAARLRAGTMPCDGAWPPEKVALFERWLAEGRAR